MKAKALILSLALIFVGFIGVKAQDANDILRKVDEKVSAAKDMKETVSMTLTDRNGRKQTRTAIIYQKGDDKRLVKFTSPASYKGIAFLSLPNDVMYVYMPAYGKERRIASSVKNQKFAGTDLTYEDLQAKNYADKYTAKIISSDANGYVLELKPKEKSQYSKLTLYITKDYLPKKVESYNRNNQKVKVMTTNFVKSGKYWYPKTMTVKDLKTKHSTTMTVKSVQFDTGLSDNIFTVRFLKQ